MPKPPWRLPPTRAEKRAEKAALETTATALDAADAVAVAEAGDVPSWTKAGAEHVLRDNGVTW